MKLKFCHESPFHSLFKKVNGSVIRHSIEFVQPFNCDFFVSNLIHSLKSVNGKNKGSKIIL